VAFLLVAKTLSFLKATIGRNKNAKINEKYYHLHKHESLKIKQKTA
jgi:hypothetical protein